MKLLIHHLSEGNENAIRICILKSKINPVFHAGGISLRKSEGFSLVELIITIVLIGIIAAVTVARYINLSDKSKAAVCMANQYALESAQTIYYTDQITKNDTNPQYASTLENLAPFMTNNTIPTCPLGYQYQILPEGKIRCPDPDHLRHF
jgi:prepilin-type N-terminal cleavage/methylation domain-containing protein